MKTRIDNVPKLRTEPSTIEAPLFNAVRLAQLRLESPLRLQLPGLRGMDIILDKNAWVCVDRTMYDLPALAWTNFETADRTSLHEPIACQLHYYHIHAGLITECVVKTTYKLLTELLAQLKS